MVIDNGLFVKCSLVEVNAVFFVSQNEALALLPTVIVNAWLLIFLMTKINDLFVKLLRQRSTLLIKHLVVRLNAVFIKKSGGKS